MFSGIVEQLAPVISIEKLPGQIVSIKVDLGRLADETRRGDSVCINGVCLTATNKQGSVVSFDAIEETLRVTNLGTLVAGSKVNVERSLRLNDRVAGHFVTGHIDKTGTIFRVEKEQDGSLKMFIKTEQDVMMLMTRKGSVAVDGISLTVVDVTKDAFSVCLIPTTLSLTTLGYKREGDIVNIEADMIGKYVMRYLNEISPRDPSRQNQLVSAS